MSAIRKQVGCAAESTFLARAADRRGHRIRAVRMRTSSTAPDVARLRYRRLQFGSWNLRYGRRRHRRRIAADARRPARGPGHFPQGRLLRADRELGVTDRDDAEAGQVIASQAVVDASHGSGCPHRGRPRGAQWRGRRSSRTPHEDDPERGRRSPPTPLPGAGAGLTEPSRNDCPYRRLVGYARGPSVTWEPSRGLRQLRNRESDRQTVLRRLWRAACIRLPRMWRD